MNDSNHIIQSLWIGESLTVMEIMCIQSYINNGHEFHLYTYSPIDNVPNETVIKDANQIIDKSEIYIDSFGGFVNLSNIFRYTLLFKNGGWWVDMDTVCLRYFDFNEIYVFSSEFSDPYKRYLCNTTFIKCPVGAQVLKDCIDFCQLRGNSYLHWGELGVNLLSRMIFRNNLSDFIKPYFVFCPISAHHLDNLILKPSPSLHLNTYAVHWWHEIWKRRHLPKNGTFHGESLYEKLKLTYYTQVF